MPGTIKLIYDKEALQSHPVARQTWDSLHSAFGYHGFHPLEARGVLMSRLALNRTEAEAHLDWLVNHGLAEANSPESLDMTFSARR